jgi:hypothetical protein
MVGRVVVVLTCTALLPIGAPAASSATIVAVVAAWQVAFLVVTRFGRRPMPAVTVADGAVLTALCVLLPVWSLPHGHLDLDDWARQVTSVVGVTAQWYTRVRGGVLMTVGLGVAVVCGAFIVPDDDWNLGTEHAVMMLWQGLLSRCLVVLVARGSRRVDELAGAVTAVRREAQLAAARRADVEVHMALLHDTVAATLTAAAAAGVGGPGLRHRAQADLARLSVQVLPGPHPQIDPATDLSVPPAGSLIRVTTVLAGPAEPGRWAGTLRSMPADAIAALAAARDEALRNVERHAGTGEARVELRLPEGGGVEVVIVDDGCGFDPAAVGVSRFGVRLSIEARMHRAGGSAHVLSAPGHGTRVQLRWPRPTGEDRWPG